MIVLVRNNTHDVNMWPIRWVAAKSVFISPVDSQYGNIFESLLNFVQ